jgi:hypothetical protein
MMLGVQFRISEGFVFHSALCFVVWLLSFVNFYEFSTFSGSHSFLDVL